MFCLLQSLDHRPRIPFDTECAYIGAEGGGRARSARTTRQGDRPRVSVFPLCALGVRLTTHAGKGAELVVPPPSPGGGRGYTYVPVWHNNRVGLT